MKKVLSVLTALVLVLALAIPAFAAADKTITIKPNDKVSPIDGRTFTAYKVLNATRTGDKIVYSVPDGAKDFMAKKFNIDENDVAFSYKVAEKIRYLQGDDLMDFATAVINAIEGGSITPLAKKTGAASGENYVISDLDEGFYVIQDDGTNKPVSALMLTTTDGEIVIKADKPTVEKKIDGNTDTDDSTSGLVDNNTAAIGDDVPFVITSTVPSTNGYKSYKMIFTDTFSSGLTYNEDSLAVTRTYVVNAETGETKTETLVKGTDYAVMKDGLEVTFTFENVKGWDGSKLEIKYTATVNENAAIGDKGNENKVILNYSDNPTQDDSMSSTPEDKTRTFVTELKLVKVDADDNSKLAGVEFELTGAKLNTVLVTDGNGNNIYKVTQENVKITVKTDANGEVKFTGLAAGEYTLTETKPLDGYNILPEPIKITIGWTAPADETKDCTWSYKQGEGESATDLKLVDGVATITVENQGGQELPSTGGIGTTIFYVVGGLLVVGAAVLLVTRRKVALEK